MSCQDNKINQTCKTSHAVCTETNLVFPEFSSLFGDACGNVNESLIDLYEIAGTIKSETDLTELESECIDFPSTPTVKNVIQLLADTICSMQEQITQLQEQNATQASQIADLQTNTCP